MCVVIGAVPHSGRLVQHHIDPQFRVCHDNTMLRMPLLSQGAVDGLENKSQLDVRKLKIQWVCQSAC